MNRGAWQATVHEVEKESDTAAKEQTAATFGDVICHYYPVTCLEMRKTSS